jgi:hypothetical protein
MPSNCRTCGGPLPARPLPPGRYYADECDDCFDERTAAPPILGQLSVAEKIQRARREQQQRARQLAKIPARDRDICLRCGRLRLEHGLADHRFRNSGARDSRVVQAISLLGNAARLTKNRPSG